MLQDPKPVRPRVDPAAADMATMVELGLAEPPKRPRPTPPAKLMRRRHGSATR